MRLSLLSPTLRLESKLGSCIKDIQYGRLTPLVESAADDDRVAEGLRRDGRAGARVGEPGDGAMRVTDAIG